MPLAHVLQYAGAPLTLAYKMLKIEIKHSADQNEFHTPDPNEQTVSRRV